MLPHISGTMVKGFMQTVLWIVGFLLLFYLTITALLYAFQSKFIYFPSREVLVTPGSVGLNYNDVRLQTEDGVMIAGWYVLAGENSKVVLFFHGNRGNISHRLDTIEILHRMELSVLMIDYRGYGQSEGNTDEQGTYLDAEAAWRYLVEERQIDPKRIIILGRSLGGGIASWLALQHPPKALILEATFTSVTDMAGQQYPFLPTKWLTRNRYDTASRLPEINVPVFIVHSPPDDVIPYSHGQHLFELANEPKVFLEIEGGHNEGFIFSQVYREGLKAFVDEYAGGY